MNKQISLENIFRAVSANFIIDSKSEKPLQLVKMPGKIKNVGVGRSLFVYFALKCGHMPDQIMEKIRMTSQEFEGKVSRINDYVSVGRDKFNNDPNAPEDIYLFFYRKFLLIRSYLQYNHQYLSDDDILQ